MKPTGSDPKGRIEIGADGNDRLNLDMVSLLPDQTWKSHGLRTDLAEAINAMHSKVFRFPGGFGLKERFSSK